MGLAITDSAGLYRHVVFPLPFKGGKRAFAPGKFIKLEELEPGLFLGSLAWERLVPSEELVHAYGCRLAKKMNDRARTAGALKQQDIRIYCGAYRLRAKEIRALRGADELEEIASADVIHHVEDGEIAHTDLRITIKHDFSYDEGTKTAIIDRLWNSCQGPLKYVCEVDMSLAEHPGSRLLTAPLGEYSDRRSKTRKRWALLIMEFLQVFL